MPLCMCVAVLPGRRVPANNFTTGLASVDKSPLVLKFSTGLSFDRPRTIWERVISKKTIHCSIIEQAKDFLLKSTACDRFTGQCLSYAQTCSAFVGKRRGFDGAWRITFAQASAQTTVGAFALRSALHRSSETGWLQSPGPGAMRKRAEGVLARRGGQVSSAMRCAADPLCRNYPQSCPLTGP